MKAADISGSIVSAKIFLQGPTEIRITRSCRVQVEKNEQNLGPYGFAHGAAAIKKFLNHREENSLTGSCSFDQREIDALTRSK